MSIDMYVSESQQQALNTKMMVGQLLAAYDELDQAAAQFAESSDVLKGKAYDSARLLITEILEPLLEGGRRLLEETQTAVSRFPEAYQEEVAAEDLKESLLEEHIQRCQFLVQQGESLIAELTVHPAGEHSKDRLQTTQNQVQSFRSLQADLEEKLARLRAFHASSPQLFAEVESLSAAFKTGLGQLRQSWQPQKGVFTLPQNRSWVQVLSNKTTLSTAFNRTEQEFMANLQAEYGFDETTAEQILIIKRGLDKKFPKLSQKERDYLLLRVLGGASYDDFKWNETAGYLSTYFYTEITGNPIKGEPQKLGKPLLEIYQDLGLTEKEAKQLNYNLRLQHEMAGGTLDIAEEMIKDNPDFYKNAKKAYKEAYGTGKGFDEFWNKKLQAYSNNGAGNADFTHQSITMATHLNPAFFQLSDLYGGRENVKDLSGWEGDTTYNANDMTPSIGEDDYKADLDAVNIAGRIEQGQSYDKAMSSYYRDVAKDDTVREKEFLQNEDWNEVKQTIYSSLVPTDILTAGEAESRAYIAEHYSDVSQFLDRLEAAAK
ncbi:hypothetical protein AB3329_06825 [Streptococcus sp. H31]|uniref:hypothetical protein n=1 Tax=Streptococcus huangxiaojuni TaxID=3237239 RepID=UPI0034A11922